MANEKIRIALSEAGVKHWQLADALGISEATVCRKMRHELPDNETSKIIETINKLRKEN